MPNMRRKLASKRRIRRAQVKKKQRAQEFLKRLGKRRGLELSDAICQEGNLQVVSEAHDAAGGSFYKSCACAGCPVGQEYIEDREEGSVSEEILGCVLVEKQWLFSRSPVKPGDVITAERP
jgi:hypothetical protein